MQSRWVDHPYPRPALMGEPSWNCLDMTTGKLTTQMTTAASSAVCIPANAALDGNPTNAPGSAADDGAIQTPNMMRCAITTE
jgi:hypothetical protein